MIDHVSIGTKDFQKATGFYDAVLEALGYKRLMTEDVPGGQMAGYGDKYPAFWVQSVSSGPDDQPVGQAFGAHVCFVAPNRAAVQAFHEAALRLGARDNGAPGLRPHYHPNYFGAFIVDPDGWRIEACCHQPE